METITVLQIVAIANLFLFSIVIGFGIFYGLDLKRWSSWLYGLYGFLSLFLVGYLFVSVKAGLSMGVAIAFIGMYAGAMTYWQRRRFKDAAEPWLAKHGQNEHLSLLAHLLKKSSKK